MSVKKATAKPEEDSDSDSSPEPRNLPAELVGYRIEKLLGEGAFGKVYKALDPESGEIYALKLVHCEDESDVFYLQREIAIHQLLKHRNIVTCHEAIALDDDTVAMVLEFVPGQELFDKIITNSFLSEATSRDLFRQIVSAVGYLQTFFVVHRDLKPENIMVTFDGRIKLMDFGFANLFDSERRLNSWCGTLNYSSPEIVGLRAYNGPEVDVWSLGVILYTMLTGFMPFDGKTGAEIAAVQKTLRHKFPKLPAYVDPACKDLLQGMLELDPARRMTLTQIAEHPWVCAGGNEPVDFYIPEQKHSIHRVDANLLAVVMRLLHLDNEAQARTQIQQQANSRAGVAYRLLKRQLKFDAKNSRPDSKHSKEMRKYWTDRIVYIFKGIVL